MFAKISLNLQLRSALFFRHPRYFTLKPVENEELVLRKFLVCTEHESGCVKVKVVPRACVGVPAKDFSVETAVEFGRLYKRNGEWKFEAMGNGYKGGLQFFVDKYVGLGKVNFDFLVALSGIVIIVSEVID